MKDLRSGLSWLHHRSWALTRVCTYAFFASCACAAFAARVVYADFQEGTLQIGKDLAGVGDLLGSTKTLFINGTTMNVSTASSDATPADILDRFESVCREHPGLLPRALADIPGTLRNKVDSVVSDTRFRLGIVRKEKGGVGAITCFSDDHSLSLAELPDRLRAFAHSHDLAAFGHFRYAYVARSAAGQTRVTTVWTEGKFNIDEMFPATGDAAGFDSPMVPRPPNARRALSATSGQVPYGVHIYDSSDPRPVLQRFYEAEMTARGWTLTVDGMERRDGVVYMNGAGALLYLMLVPNGTRTMITAIETARVDTPTLADVRVEN